MCLRILMLSLKTNNQNCLFLLSQILLNSQMSLTHTQMLLRLLMKQFPNISNSYRLNFFQPSLTLTLDSVLCCVVQRQNIANTHYTFVIYIYIDIYIIYSSIIGQFGVQF